MKITFTPVRSDARLALSRAGDRLTLNGEVFDFAPLPDGAVLPPDAIDSDWFPGPVTRVDGHLHVTLILPHGPDAPDATRFPAPLILAEDGPVTLPPHDATKDTP